MKALHAQMHCCSTHVGFPKSAPVAEREPVADGEPVAERETKTMAELAEIVLFLHSPRKTASGVKSWPFMMSCNERIVPELRVLLRKEYRNIIKGKKTIRTALSGIGEYATGEIQNEIRDTMTPALEPYTIRRKKSSKPLIDSGQMYQSVTHVEVIS
jgi:hypothetical protein